MCEYFAASIFWAARFSMHIHLKSCHPQGISPRGGRGATAPPLLPNFDQNHLYLPQISDFCPPTFGLTQSCPPTFRQLRNPLIHIYVLVYYCVYIFWTLSWFPNPSISRFYKEWENEESKVCKKKQVFDKSTVNKHLEALWKKIVVSEKLKTKNW